MKTQTLALSLACLAPFSLAARLGTVETKDRKAFVGQVRLDTNLVVVASAERNLVVRLPARQLREITFDGRIGPASGPSADEPQDLEGKLPRPWQSQDIGRGPQAEGRATWHAGLFRLQSEGQRVGGRSDSFHFIYKSIQGDSELVARLLACSPAGTEPRGGLMMRESLQPDAENVMLAVAGGRGGFFAWRPEAGLETVPNAKADLSVRQWLKLRRDGDTFAAYRSATGRSWVLLDQVTLPMAEQIHVGLALCGAPDGSIGRALFDNVSEAPYLANDWFVPRVELRSGSVLVGRIATVDNALVRFAGPLPPAPVPLEQVTRLFFRWLPFGLTAKVDSGRPGVLLTTGDFIDGELKGFAKGRVELSSILFGLRRFDVHQDVIAVVLGQPIRGRQACEVKTVQGSLWKTDRVEIGRNEVFVHDAALGRTTIPIHELAELRWP